MIVRSLIKLAYVLVIASAIAMAIITHDLHILILALIVLVVMYTSFTLLLTYFDDRLEVPESKILGSTGSTPYRVKISDHLYGTYPIHIYSGEQKVAEVYRGSDIMLHLSSDRSIAISRESRYEDVEGFVLLSPDGINYVFEKNEIGNIMIDHYPSEDAIDDLPYILEYGQIKERFWAFDKNALGVAVTSILILLIAYSKLRNVHPY